MARSVRRRLRSVEEGAAPPAHPRWWAGTARLRRATRWLRRASAEQRRLHAEAVLELARASLALAVRPGRATADLLGRAVPPTDVAGRPSPVALTPVAEGIAAGVGSAVGRAARALPWRPSCLRQALAARRMLDRRGVPCLLHLGVVDARVEVAHAWVTAGRQVVVGGRGLDRYTTVATFAGAPRTDVTHR